MVLVEVRNNLKQTLSHLDSKLLWCGSCKLQSIQLIWIIPNSIYFQAGSQQKAVYIKLINSENEYTAGMTLCDITRLTWGIQRDEYDGMWHVDEHSVSIRMMAERRADVRSYGWSVDQIGLTGLTSHSHIMDQGCKHYDAIWHIDFSSQANRL